MTDKLDRTLDLNGDYDEPPEFNYDDFPDEVDNAAIAILNNISAEEKIDSALFAVTDLHIHEKEMDDIARRAISTYEELCAIGSSAPGLQAGKFYESAAVMLKTAMEAKEAKLQRKLKMIDLQLKKLRIDKLTVTNTKESEEETDSSVEFDRNELIKHMIESNKKEGQDE